MASMRRRLRGITSRVTGGIAPSTPALEEHEPPVETPVEPPVGETGGVTPATDAPATGVPTDLPTDLPTASPATPVEAQVVVDALCAAAIELSRAVAVGAGGSSVGEHLGVEADDDLVVTHSFATTDPAYVGWRWAVTVTRADGTDVVTVDEVVLLPGSGALLAPAWVPWSERVQPGDLAPGDLLPPPADDPRVVPAYAEAEADLAAETFWELGLGRPRVLSADGRQGAAERWYDGDRGPHAPMARQAPGQCLDCAFRVPLAGELTAMFGVCANVFSPDDARVVSLDHGCGAHSETAVELTHASGAAGMVVEDEELEVVLSGPSPDDETPDGHAS